MEDKRFDEVLDATQVITRKILKTVGGVAVIAASIWVYLAAFGVVDQPTDQIKGIAAKADSIIITERTIDSLNVDTLKTN